MDKKIKARWIKALRSGRYRQIQLDLADSENGRCCLGVLRTICRNKSHHQNDAQMLSPEFCEKVGLGPEIAAECAGTPPKKSQGYLSLLNDDKGYSFEEIADFIENNL